MTVKFKFSSCLHYPCNLPHALILAEIEGPVYEDTKYVWGRLAYGYLAVIWTDGPICKNRYMYGILLLHNKENQNKVTRAFYNRKKKVNK